MTKKHTLAIRAIPKSSSNRIGEVRKLANGEEQLVVYVTSPPDDGKANEAVIKLLAKHLGVAPSRLSIIRGETSRNKLILVE